MLPESIEILDIPRYMARIEKLPSKLKKLRVHNQSQHLLDYEKFKDLGIEGGRPVFLSGHRRVTDEEYEYQRQRLEWGLIPDELDLPAFKEEYKNKKVRDAQGIRLTD